MSAWLRQHKIVSGALVAMLVVGLIAVAAFEPGMLREEWWLSRPELIVFVVVLVAIGALVIFLVRLPGRAAKASQPGWFTDPEGSRRQRWYDGQRWTDTYRDSA